MATYTDKLNLRIPALGATGWNEPLDENIEILDTALAQLLAGNAVRSGCVPSDGGGLDVDYTAGSVVVAGTTHTIASGSKTATASLKSYLYVDDAGAVQCSTNVPTGDFALLALVDAGAASLDNVADLRNLVEALGDATSLEGLSADELAVMEGFKTNYRHKGYSGDLDDIDQNSVYHLKGDEVTNEPAFIGTNTGVVWTQVHQDTTNIRAQLCWGMNITDGDARLAFRRLASGAWTSWAEILTTDATGPGSGLDADTLDGQEGAAYLRSNQSDTLAGALTIQRTGSSQWIILEDLVVGNRLVFRNSGDGMRFLIVPAPLGVNDYTKQIKYDFAVGQWDILGAPLADGAKIWTAGNDGAGSGLDADTVDGIQAASFLRSDDNDAFASDKSLTLGDGAGAVRIQHNSTTSRTYFRPYIGSAFDADKELGFDASAEQWNIEGAPLAGGNQIVTVADHFLGGLKNRLVNPNFDIWQRGTSFAVTGYAYWADRWCGRREASSSGATISRVANTGVPGAAYSMRVQRDSGNTSTHDIFAWQTIETLNCLDLAGEQVSISFWARKGANYSDDNSELLIKLLESTTEDDAIGPYDSPYQAHSVTLTTSWQKFTYTFPVDIGSTAKTLALMFYHDPTGTAGADDWFEISQVQLEKGEVSTPFEQRNVGGVELHLCKRYYEEFDYNSTNWTGASIVWNKTTEGVVSGLACEVAKRTEDATITTANLKYRIVSTRYGFTPTGVDIDHDRRILHIVGTPGHTATVGQSHALESTNNLKITVDAEL